MKIETSQPTRADAALLRNTVLRLTAATRVFTVALVIIVALVWWYMLHKVIAFGRGLDYDGLQALGGQVVTFVKQYNPFFWWAVVALCTLIIAYFLYGFAESMNRRASRRRVDADIIAVLINRLTPPAIRVLRWSWQDRREPITVGVLQRAQRELQGGRAALIELAERHTALLDTATAAPSENPPLPTRSNYV